MIDLTKDFKTRQDVEFLNNQQGLNIQEKLGNHKISQNMVKNETK